MLRERALRILLVLVGLLFSAAIYPAIGGLLDPAHSDSGDTQVIGHQRIHHRLTTNGQRPAAGDHLNYFLDARFLPHTVSACCARWRRVAGLGTPAARYAERADVRVIAPGILDSTDRE